MTSYTLIYNPEAGRKGASAVAEHMASRIKAAGHTALLQPTKAPGDATDLAFHAKSEVVVAIGGDGTINQVAGGLVKRRTPPRLGIIPQGTVNNLAKVLHIPLMPDLALVNLLEGTPHDLDIGIVNDRVMISTLTLGVLANAAVSVSQKDKQRFGPIVYLTRGLHSLSRNQHWHLKITGNGTTWERNTSFLLVTMTNSVGGFRNFAPQAKPDDGLFHVFVAPKPTLGGFLLMLPYFLTGNFAKLPGMTYFAADSLTIENKTPNTKLKSRIDGDPSVGLPLRMQVISGKVQVLTKPVEPLGEKLGKLAQATPPAPKA
ncbi:diacylglycerol/lipid kinase family protein [Lacticaseibacillus hegangensis]|uniref:Diacylglycerol/lipid kinase family protein n=1 Tax=Lacticaseibacillus hegangensis TaxID=2486010 RepID=A0ABW4CWB5_9LACO|nr:diacylglycerol kinase family protein [Lacticaseibacillus hegangensis]